MHEKTSYGIQIVSGKVIRNVINADTQKMLEIEK